MGYLPKAMRPERRDGDFREETRICLALVRLFDLLVRPPKGHTVYGRRILSESGY